MSNTRKEITDLLVKAKDGDRRAVDLLLPAVYAELRAVASHFLADQRSEHTLQPTALVHEAYLRLVGSEGREWESRAHFYRVAARAMRHVLVDHARRRRAGKREGRLQRVQLGDAPDPGLAPNLDLLALDEALGALAAFDSTLR